MKLLNISITSVFPRNNLSRIRDKAKLLGNTISQDAPNQANGILKNATIAMSLVNCKVELKLKRTKYCVLSGDSDDNFNECLSKISMTKKLKEHIGFRCSFTEIRLYTLILLKLNIFLKTY